MNSQLLVLLQLAALVGLTYTSSIPGLDSAADLVSFSGIALGLWSLWEMRFSKFSIFPEVPKGATLVTTGPYAFIRHPMYTALMIYAVGRVMNNFSAWTVLYASFLVVLLRIKIEREEAFLMRAFKKYKEYTKTTSRLIPGVY